MFQESGKKYFKRGDLVAKELEEYRQKYGKTQDNLSEISTEEVEGSISLFLFMPIAWVENGT